MKKILSSLAVALCGTISTQAQIFSCASQLHPQQKADVVIPFKFTDEGKQTPIEWGLDLAWLSEDNVRTGVLFAGQNIIDIIRTSYRPTDSVEDGVLADSQLIFVKQRADIIKKWCKSGVQVNINDDNPKVASWYNAAGTSTMRGQRWAKVIDLHYDAYKAQGITNIVSISPYNEPDYGWDQGYSSATRQADMKATCKSLKEDFNGKYDGVRICGGNTLNDDCAYDWWNYMKEYLDEGNTHQLAGNFDNYASFFQTVREAGMHATADELHNTMEAMVGVEYGMQTGIWWGTAEYTRSQFMKATYQGNPGSRLAYAEHRDNWTAASVYRLTDGRVQGFGGTSERQAVETKYDFLSLDRPVWYDGQRGWNYVMDLPGGTGYQVGQVNAETLVNIESGTDVMPHITGGVYKLMNVNSGLIAGYSSKPTSGWTSLTQKKNSNTTKSLQWVLTPRNSDGDLNYWTLTLNTDNNMILDIKDWNYNDGADVGVYPGGVGTNEQWYLEYAGNGAFYIRSRFSTKCLEVKDGKTTAAANIQMGTPNGSTYQMWRFIPVKVTPDLVAPAAPSALTATSQNASVRLTWQAPSDTDIKSYTILRSTDDSDYYTLANEVTSTEFVDNEACDGVVYYYKVYAEDNSLNHGEATASVQGYSSMEKGEVMTLQFDSLLTDETVNGNHCVLVGDTTFATKNTHDAISLNGTSNFIQLPYTVANHDELSISFWVYYRGGNNWQRIFDFGNGTDQYMFLTPNYGSGLSFAIKNGGDEQLLRPGKTLTTTKWHHIVITLGQNGGVMYLDGTAIATNENISIKPSDIHPVLNYIGRSQFTADPYFKGYIDDFRIYNYALSAEEVSDLATGVEEVRSSELGVKSPAYDLSGRRADHNSRIIIRDGKKILK